MKPKCSSRTRVAAIGGYAEVLLPLGILAAKSRAVHAAGECSLSFI
jgi:hypothetical protein